ncbi:MAG: type III pantothenate kinase, partial [Chloroflexi bacterium]|nr:type III pantothenate kinase [Chloroflexota bacterium]
MLLALDIGNTNITLGVFRGETLEATARLSTDASRMPDEYGLLISQLLPAKGVSPDDVEAIVMCSVVPPLTQTIIEVCEGYFNVPPLVVGAGTKTGIRILYDSPRDVGAD